MKDNATKPKTSNRTNAASNPQQVEQCCKLPKKVNSNQKAPTGDTENNQHHEKENSTLNNRKEHISTVSNNAQHTLEDNTNQLHPQSQQQQATANNAYVSEMIVFSNTTCTITQNEQNNNDENLSRKLSIKHNADNGNTPKTKAKPKKKKKKKNKTNTNYKKRKLSEDQQPEISRATKKRKTVVCGNDSNITIDISNLYYPDDFKFEITKRNLRRSNKPRNKKANNKNGKFKCDICKGSFKSMTQLLNHKRNHKNFKCPICSATKARQSAFQDHMDRHFGYKRHQCKDCLRNFHRSGLNQHKCIINSS